MDRMTGVARKGARGWAAALAALALAGGQAHGRKGPEHETLRPLGMGNAFVAVVDDKDAMHYNPAGLNLMGRLGNKAKDPAQADYPLNRFDMHMDFLGTGLPVSQAFDILNFWQSHRAAFTSFDSLQNDKSITSDLARFDRVPVDFSVLHGGELAFHNFGMSYWADAQAAPYVDAGIILPQAGVERIQVDAVGEIAGATSFLEDRLSVGLEYRMAKREEVGNYQVSLADLADQQRRKQVEQAPQDTLDAKLGELADLGSIGHGLDVGVLWQQTPDIRFGASCQNLFMRLNHQSLTPDLRMGVAYSPMFLQNNRAWKRKINFAMDLEDLLNNDNGYKPLSKIDIGAEWEQTLIPWILKGRLSAGLKGGYPTVGIGGNLFTVFSYEFATWAQEGGYYTGQQEDRYYVMKFGIGL